MQVANRKPIFQVVGGASLLQVCLSLVQGVCLLPWTRALLQFLRRSSLHVCTVMRRLSLTDIGTGVWSQEGVGCAAHFEAERSFHVLELSNRSLRRDSATVAKARCTSAVRAQKSTCRLAGRHKQIRYERLLYSMGCGICDCIAKEHRQWDRCHGPHLSAADRRLLTIDWAFGKFGLRRDRPCRPEQHRRSASQRAWPSRQANTSWV